MSVPENHWPMTEKGRPATSGTGRERFTLHIPFSIFPLGIFSELDGLSSGQWLPLPVASKRVTVERCDNDFYILRVEGFETRKEAEDYLEQASLALLRLAVDKEMAIGFSPKQAGAEEKANRENHEALHFLRRSREQFARECLPAWRRADGTYTDDGFPSSQTVILPEHERVWERRAAMGHEIKAIDTSMLARALAKQETSPDPRGLLDDRKFLLAVNMLGAANSVYNLKVRFVLLVTVLEILAQFGERPKFSQETLKSLLERLKEKHTSSESEESELQKICSAVGKLRTVSITEGLCDLVFRSCATTLPEFADREKSDKIVKELYSIRGNIVHKGRVSSNDGKAGDVPFIERFEQLRKAVSGVLKYRMDHPEPDPESVC